MSFPATPQSTTTGSTPNLTPGTSPIGDFARLFTNMTMEQQREFSLALLDVQNSLEITSLATSLSLLERNPDQSLPIPVVTVTPAVRGGTIQWNPLPDQLVNFFEIDVSTTNNFASFNTTNTFGNQATLAGLTGQVFIRVRGVRKDGTTTPYSNTVTLTPNLFSILLHVDEVFYLVPPKNVFYPVCKIKYTPVDPNGQSMVFGMVNVFADPSVCVYGLPDIEFRVTHQQFYPNGTTSTAVEAWRATCGEYFDCVAIGPIPIDHPGANNKLQIALQFRDTTQDGSTPVSQIPFAHLNAFEVGVG